MQSNESRLFVAIPIPENYRKVLEQWTQQLRINWAFKRWLHPDDYHITLKFLGECNRQRIPMIQQQLQTIALAQVPFTLSISELGTFNNTVSTKILWAGVLGQLDELHKLQKKVESSMDRLDFKKETNEYRPHITLARNYLNGILSSGDIAKAPAVAIHETLKWEVKEMVLYQTHLGKSPSYEPLITFTFEKANTIS